jgi:RES domain-containing protein
MRLWRIVQSKWALDKLCAGARAEGGRWNPAGIPALYAGTNVEICALEKLAHLAGVNHPPLKLVSVDIPDNPKLVYTPAMKLFPTGWSDLPISAASQEFGRRWLEEAEQLVMLVPSVLVPEAKNAVINPLHSEYKRVVLKIVRDFTFDSRMFKA